MISSRPQIIPSRGELKRKAVNYKKGVDLNLAPEVLKKLETVIESSKDEFTVEVAAKLREMRDLFNASKDDAVEALKFCSKALDETLEIKGMGGMFGYPLLTVVAKSLNDFLQVADPANGRHLEIIGLHIDALYVILANRIMGAGVGIDQEVVNALREAVAIYREPIMATNESANSF